MIDYGEKGEWDWAKGSRQSDREKIKGTEEMATPPPFPVNLPVEGSELPVKIKLIPRLKDVGLDCVPLR